MKPSAVLLATAALIIGAGAEIPLGDLLPGPTPLHALQADRAMEPIDAPEPGTCISDVSPGDHTFTCGDLTYYVMVDEACTRLSCGLIFDIHGASMSGEVMRQNTNLHVLAPEHGYVVVHPSAAPPGETGTWSFETSPPQMADVLFETIEVFQVDRARVHVTGFSMGAAMTFWFLCNHPEILASTAVVTGSSADQVPAPDGDGTCIESIDADWEPRVPILFMNGILDVALSADAAQARTDGLVSRLGLTGGEEIAGDDHYTRRRWADEGGMVLDFIEHDYTAQLERLGGHCMPGGGEPVYTTCTEGEIALDWGELALDWFVEHPKGGM